MRYFSSSVVSTAYKITRTVIGVECDVCHKVIPAGCWGDQNTRYFEVTTGHTEWGNDSCDSIETLDICPDCVAEYLSNYLRDSRNSAYFRLKTEFSEKSDKETKIVDKPPKEGEITKQGHDWY